MTRLRGWLRVAEGGSRTPVAGAGEVLRVKLRGRSARRRGAAAINKLSLGSASGSSLGSPARPLPGRNSFSVQHGLFCTPPRRCEASSCCDLTSPPPGLRRRNTHTYAHAQTHYHVINSSQTHLLLVGISNSRNSRRPSQTAPSPCPGSVCSSSFFFI